MSKLSAYLSTILFFQSIMLVGSVAHAMQTLSVAVEPRINPKLAIFQLRFEAKYKPSFYIAASGNKLYVRFDKPYQVSTSLIEKKLHPFVSKVSMSEDRKALYLVADKPVLMFEKLKDHTIAGVDLSFDMHGNAKDYPFDKKPPKQVLKKKEPKQKVAEPVQIKPQQQEVLPSYRFSWNKPVSMALFKRGNYSWVVFDRYKKIDIETIHTKLEKVTRVEQIADPRFTILRLRHNSEREFQVKQDGQDWVIEQAKDTASVSFPLSIKRKGMSKLEVTSNNVANIKGEMLQIRDPDIGDMIMAIPFPKVGYGVTKLTKEIDYSLLPSVQGMAIVAHHDEVVITPTRRGYQVTSPSLMQAEW